MRRGKIERRRRCQRIADAIERQLERLVGRRRGIRAMRKRLCCARFGGAAPGAGKSDHAGRRWRYRRRWRSGLQGLAPAPRIRSKRDENLPFGMIRDVVEASMHPLSG